MIASRFWFGVLGLALAFALLVLELAVSMHDRLGMRMVSEGLSADSRVVSWYLKNSAREDAAQLIRFLLAASGHVRDRHRKISWPPTPQEAGVV